ncbi:COL6A [Mytilus edulis]|uniref:COL6A n=1 Tax=Mytilus edulis TaxID=6550 RepID=A0A8S3VIY8_MYTED|nr:COL6A [Mytilus edulis]
MQTLDHQWNILQKQPQRHLKRIYKKETKTLSTNYIHKATTQSSSKFIPKISTNLWTRYLPLMTTKPSSKYVSEVTQKSFTTFQPTKAMENTVKGAQDQSTTQSRIRNEIPTDILPDPVSVSLSPSLTENQKGTSLKSGQLSTLDYPSVNVLVTQPSTQSPMFKHSQTYFDKTYDTKRTTKSTEVERKPTTKRPKYTSWTEDELPTDSVTFKTTKSAVVERKPTTIRQKSTSRIENKIPTDGVTYKTTKSTVVERKPTTIRPKSTSWIENEIPTDGVTYKTTKSTVVERKPTTIRPKSTSRIENKKPTDVITYKTDKRNELTTLKPFDPSKRGELKTGQIGTRGPATQPPKKYNPPLRDSESADMVIAFHASSSTSRNDFQRMLNFVKDLVSRADFDGGRARLGVMAYGENPSVQFNLNEHTTWREVSNAISSINENVKSNIVDTSGALIEALIMFDDQYARADVPKAVFLITDTASTVNSDFLSDQTEVMRSEGIEVFPIGIGVRDKSELETIATNPRNVHTVSRYSDLSTLTNLLRRDIRSLSVNGERQTVPTIPIGFPGVPPIAITFPPPKSGCSAEVDLVIILDSSTSVGTDNFEKMKNFVKELLRNADIDNDRARVGIVTYSTRVNVEFELNTYRTSADVDTAVGNIKYTYGSTNTADAIAKMREMFSQRNGDRPGVPNVGIIITDGVSNINSRRTIPEAVGARDQDNIHVYAIGIGLADTRELDGMASKPIDENRFTVKSFDELRGFDRKIFQAICKVPVTLPPSTSSCAGAKIDLVIILDSSTSVGDANYKKMLTFCKDFLTNADIDSGNVKVGVLSYSTGVNVEFYLNSHSTKQDIFNAIDNIPYRYGSTNTADGLKTMRTDLYTSRNGDRDGVPNVVIILTDGVSNINSRRTIPEAVLARGDGIHIYAVGIGLRDTRELDAIATPPATENSFNVQSFDELTALSEKVFQAFCPVATTPEPVKELHGYDIVIIVDSSVDTTQFASFQKFARRFVRQAKIEDGEYRIGLLRYSTDADVQFDLNSYDTTRDARFKVDSMTHKAGDPNTANAIDHATRQMFRTDKGDRAYARNYIILLTGQDRSLSTNEAWAAAERAEDNGIQLYVVGLEIDDTTELDETPSHPLSTYQYLTRTEREMLEVPDKIRETLPPMPKTPPPMRPRPRLATPIPITIPTPAAGGCALAKVDMVIILDSSTSVGSDNYDKMKDFCKDFLRNADLDSGNVRVGILSYSTAVKVEFYLNSFSTSQEILDAIDNIPYRYGSTNTADSLQRMREEMFSVANGDRLGVPDICLILTDGVSNINSRRTIPEAEKSRAAGIHIYAIGIGLQDTRELDGIASVPSSENSFNVQSFDELSVLSERVFEAFCPVATTVKPKDTGYDLVVILDSSVSQEYFDWMTTFTKNLADTVSIDDDEFRVGLLRYSTDSNVQFNLKDYQSSGDVQNAVDQVGYKGGVTNTAQAIDTARTQMFRPDQGDRDYARNFILLITGQDKSLSTNDAWRAAERAETDGIQLYVMGLNINDREELDETSSHPLNTYQYLTRSERELAEVPPQIYADLLGMAKNPPPMRPRPVKPDVNIKPYRSTVRYGGPVTIECTVKSGIPVKEVTWYRVQGDSRTPVVVDGRKYSGST